MNKYPIETGSVVISNMGRDAGKTYLVYQEIDPDFVTLIDGGLRGVERPKKKRRKHLKTTGIVVEEYLERVRKGEAVQNHEVRSWLKREEK